MTGHEQAPRPGTGAERVPQPPAMNLTTPGADETERLAIVAALSAVYARAAASGGPAAAGAAPVRRWARPSLRAGLGRGPGAWRSSGGWRR